MFIELVKIYNDNLVYMLKGKFEAYELVCFISGYQDPVKLGTINLPKGTDIEALGTILNANL